MFVICSSAGLLEQKNFHKNKNPCNEITWVKKKWLLKFQNCIQLPGSVRIASNQQQFQQSVLQLLS